MGKRGFVIGMINYPSKNFIVSVNVTPRGKSDYWSTNIYSFKDDPTSEDMQPVLDFKPNSYMISSVIFVNGRYISASNQNSLTQNVAYTVTTKVLGDDITLYVDGKVVGTNIVNYADRGDFTKLYAF